MTEASRGSRTIAEEGLCRESIRHLEAARAGAEPGNLRTLINEILVVEQERLRTISRDGA
jgi:hypothetical protein